MAVMPGVDYQPVAGLTTAMSRYDIVCIHTIVGNDPAPAAHFSTRGDGHITQSRDTHYRSAANLDGNYRVIAIENDDFGPEFGAWGGSDVPAFTSAQCESIAQICAWAHQAHGIPLVLAPDSKPTSRGIAYHRQGIDSANNFSGFAYGGRVSGGEHWSASTGKVCPGDRRISQLIHTIIPRARVIAGLDTEVDVTPEEHDKLLRVWAIVEELDKHFPGGVGPFAEAVREIMLRMRSVHYGGFAPVEGGPGGDLAFLDTKLANTVAPLHAKVDALAGMLSDDEANIITAIRSQPADGQPSAEQMGALAAQLTSTLGPAFAAELGRRLSQS